MKGEVKGNATSKKLGNTALDNTIIILQCYFVAIVIFVCSGSSRIHKLVLFLAEFYFS